MDNLDINVIDMPFKLRVINKLLRSNINYAADIIAYDKRDYKRLKGLGFNNFLQIENYIENTLGLAFVKKEVNSIKIIDSLKYVIRG